MVMFTAILLSVPGHCSSRASADPFKDEVITREQRAFGLVTIYATAKQHFPYFEQLPKLDWDKTFIEYLPQVEKKQSLYDYYLVLQRFAALLEDGHTGVNFPQSIDKELDLLPFRVDLVEGKWIVTGRVPTDEIVKEDIPMGSVLESIEGQEPGKYFADTYYPYLRGREQVKAASLVWAATYPRNTKVNVAFRYDDGSLHKRVMTANRSSLKWTDELRTKYTASWRWGPGFQSRELDSGILYIVFRMCDSDSEGKVVKLLESRKSQWPKGIILDIRMNPGGMSPINCLQHLISKPVQWDKMTTRYSISYMEAQTQGKSEADAARWLKNHGVSKQFAPGWYAPGGSGTIALADVHYDGPLAILTSPYTASAAEHLVVLLKQAGRGKVIGDRTYGSAGQPVMFDLPGGGEGRVITTKSTYADGREYTDVGCEPDTLVPMTIKGMTKNRDEVLDAAVSYLRQAAQ